MAGCLACSRIASRDAVSLSGSGGNSSALYAGEEIGESPDVLDDIEAVKYILHPSFAESVQVSRSPEDGFDLEAFG